MIVEGGAAAQRKSDAPLVFSASSASSADKKVFFATLCPAYLFLRRTAARDRSQIDLHLGHRSVVRVDGPPSIPLSDHATSTRRDDLHSLSRCVDAGCAFEIVGIVLPRAAYPPPLSDF